jgi:hypothetical protein
MNTQQNQNDPAGGCQPTGAPPVLQQYEAEHTAFKRKAEMKRNGWILLAIGILGSVLIGDKLGGGLGAGRDAALGACMVFGIGCLIAAARIRVGLMGARISELRESERKMEEEAFAHLEKAIKLETSGKFPEALAKYQEVVTKWGNSTTGKEAQQCIESLRRKTGHDESA